MKRTPDHGAPRGLKPAALVHDRRKNIPTPEASLNVARVRLRSSRGCYPSTLGADGRPVYPAPAPAAPPAAAARCCRSACAAAGCDIVEPSAPSIARRTGW